jgi:hypothetical protein
MSRPDPYIVVDMMFADEDEIDCYLDIVFAEEDEIECTFDEPVAAPQSAVVQWCLLGLW